MFFDHCLPARELLGCQVISLTGILERDQASLDSIDDLGFPPGHPAPGVPRWQIMDGHDIAIRSNDTWIGIQLRQMVRILLQYVVNKHDELVIGSCM